PLYRRRADVIARHIGEEVILVPLTKGAGDLENLYTLNEVAAYIWEKTEQPQSLEEIVQEVVREFEVQEAEAAADAAAFLSDMVAAGLMERRETREEV
ncbi:MAG: PqqD family protein, partial [Planctomycetota bacterium]|nr:PqqD family protein [Planctomycetota bacterium]